MVDELHLSLAFGDVCCEDCHCAASPPTDLAGARYRAPAPSRRRPKRDPYGELFERVYAALTRSERHAFGVGDPTLPLMGYCPACERGTIAITLVHAREPFLRTQGCSAGCSPELVVRAI